MQYDNHGVSTREENDEAIGCYFIKVAQHKTASRGPARVFVDKDISTLMDIYYHNVKSVIKPLCSVHRL